MDDFDFSAMQQKMAAELASDVKSESGYDSKYPIYYTRQNGKLKVKLLVNKKMGGLQKRLVRHPADAEGKVKVPCLSVYGETCPICEAIKEVENAKGKEIGAFRKYGYSVRGVCYAQLIEHDSSMFTEPNSPRIKDIITLMYPKTVYDKFNKVLVDAGANVVDVLGKNEGMPIIIERSQKPKDFPKFEVNIDPFHKEKSYATDGEYEAMLDELPDLTDAFYPRTLTDEIKTKVQAVAEAITQEYLGSTIVNPTPVTEDTKTPVGEVKPFETEDDNDDLPFEVGTPETTASVEEAEKVVDEVLDAKIPDGMPSCFGKHEDNSDKCNSCVHECDCVLAQS